MGWGGEGGGGLQFGVYQQYFNIQHCAAHFVKLKGSQLNPDSIIRTRRNNKCIILHTNSICHSSFSLQLIFYLTYFNSISEFINILNGYTCYFFIFLIYPQFTKFTIFLVSTYQSHFI